MTALTTLAIPLLSLSLAGTCQVYKVGKATPSPLNHFVTSGVSRLNAIARLGAVKQSTLLIVCGDMRFLNEPIILSESNKTEDELIGEILKGRERYRATHRGALTIISPSRPLVPTNRILGLSLGSISFTGKAISSLSSLMDFYIRKATGCAPMGYAYAGPPLDDNIPAFTLRSATFESVVERVADAPLPTMWILLPDSGKAGCLPHPGSMWQVGLYAGQHLQSPFRESIGPQLVR